MAILKRAKVGAGHSEVEYSVRLHRNHTYSAGVKDGTILVAFKGPLDNTGIIITLKDVRTTQASLTPQAKAALQVTSCLHTF
jgi:hypothetical protein